MSFPAYPQYKHSGVPWLGAVPGHWEVVPGRRQFRQMREPSLASDEQLSASQKYGVIPQSRLMQLEDQKVVLALKGLDGFKHVNPNDFVISLRSFQGGIEHSAYEGCVSPAYTVLRPTREQVARFFAYALKSQPYISALQAVTDGIRDGKNISFEQFGQVGLPVPSMLEQTAIAAFLDRETAKIDALVAEQERLIALLKEKRQAVISHAVTKGLNPHAPMKDSGIEWLGEIPAHWLAGKLKHVALVKGRIGFRGYTADDLVAEGEGALVLGGSNMGSDDRLTLEKRTYVSWEKYEESPEIMVFEGDLIVGQRGTCGRAVLIDVDLGPTTINPSLVVLKNLSAKATFLTYSINANHAQSIVASILSKTAVPMISQEQIGNLPISLPPEEEQEAISEFLNQSCDGIDRLIGDAQQGITLLQERRAALISAAVTGKIDVRGLVDQQELEAA